MNISENYILANISEFTVCFIFACFRPGAYEHNLKRNKQVQWHQSFGGRPISMPQIQVRSIIDQNTSKVR